MRDNKKKNCRLQYDHYFNVVYSWARSRRFFTKLVITITKQYYSKKLFTDESFLALFDEVLLVQVYLIELS